MFKLVVLSIVLVIALAQEVVRDVPVPTRYVPPRVYRRPDVYHAPRYTGRVEDRINYIDESPKPYAFSYEAPSDDGAGSSSRSESSDGSGRVVGTYTLVNGEGHTRYVDYTADENGFRAQIRTNEPGTTNESPADVVLESAAPHPFAANFDRSYYSVRPSVHRTHTRGRIPAAAVTVEDVDHQPLVESPVVIPRRPVPSYSRRVAYRSPYY